MLYSFEACNCPFFTPHAHWQDLFPGLEVPSNDYGEFSVALEEQLDKHGLQKVGVLCRNVARASGRGRSAQTCL